MALSPSVNGDPAGTAPDTVPATTGVRRHRGAISGRHHRRATRKLPASQRAVDSNATGSVPGGQTATARTGNGAPRRAPEQLPGCLPSGSRGLARRYFSGNRPISRRHRADVVHAVRRGGCGIRLPASAGRALADLRRRAAATPEAVTSSPGCARGDHSPIRKVAGRRPRRRRRGQHPAEDHGRAAPPCERRPREGDEIFQRLPRYPPLPGGGWRDRVPGLVMYRRA